MKFNVEQKFNWKYLKLVTQLYLDLFKSQTQNYVRSKMLIKNRTYLFMVFTSTLNNSKYPEFYFCYLHCDGSPESFILINSTTLGTFKYEFQLLSENLYVPSKR